MSEELKPCPHCEDAMPVINRVGKCYTVECGCGMTGPYGDEPIEAIAAWNALPRKLRFSREKPTEPGAYWYKSKGLLYLCEIHTTFGLTGLFCSVLAGEMARDLAEMDGEWAGPIPEPEE